MTNVSRLYTLQLNIGIGIPLRRPDASLPGSRAATVTLQLHILNLFRSVAGSRDLAGSRNDSFARDLDLESEFRPRGRPLSEALDDEDTVFDSHGQRTRRAAASENFASEVEATTRRFKARVAALNFDDDLENNLRPKFEPGSKLFESFAGTSVRSESERQARSAIEDADAAFKRRSRFFAEDIAEEKPALTKWSKVPGLEDDAHSAAANRAKQTRARLNDLETEMEEIAERQAKREQRSAALRALVNENASVDTENVASSYVSKKLAVRSERADKHVAF